MNNLNLYKNTIHRSTMHHIIYALLTAKNTFIFPKSGLCLFLKFEFLELMKNLDIRHKMHLEHCAKYLEYH